MIGAHKRNTGPMLTSLRCGAKNSLGQTLQVTIGPRQKALPHAWGRAGVGRPTRQ